MARLEIAADPTTQSGSHNTNMTHAPWPPQMALPHMTPQRTPAMVSRVLSELELRSLAAGQIVITQRSVVTHHRMWPVTHSRLLTMIEQQQKLRLCVSHALSWTVKACRYRINIEARVEM